MSKHPVYCPDCNGTGRDAKKTALALQERRISEGEGIRCWTCNGNGLYPAAYFTWGPYQESSDLTSEPDQDTHVDKKVEP